MVKFTVGYTASVGALTTQHETTMSAFDAARRYIAQGHETVAMKNLETGEEHDTTALKLALERIDRLNRNA